jgi:hypothetical protein
MASKPQCFIIHTEEGNCEFQAVPRARLSKIQQQNPLIVKGAPKGPHEQNEVNTREFSRKGAKAQRREEERKMVEKNIMTKRQNGMREQV